MQTQTPFTKKSLEMLRPDLLKRLYVYDKRQPGLVLCVTPAGTKSYQIYKRAGGNDGKPIRVTLGRFTDLSIEQARNLAKLQLAEIAKGKHPNREKRAQRAKGVTLKEVFDDYLKARNNLKPGTVFDYNRIINESFKDWQPKAMRSITRDSVENRHQSLGKRSRARANNSMRLLRALFNYAAGKYEDAEGHSLFPDNPVKRLSHTRSWYEINRRQTLIRAHDLEAWFLAAMSLKSEAGGEQAETIRDYLIFLLLTGLRREEGAKLQWKQIDFVGRTLTITDTKNKAPHTLPLSDHLHSMLKVRKAYSDSIYAGDDAKNNPARNYVFPGTGKNGHIINASKQIAKVSTLSGVPFTLHDLRRTFITIAESLDIPAYALKQLLNHKNKNDVTAGYIIVDVERLRKPMQGITDFILKSAGLMESSPVVAIK